MKQSVYCAVRTGSLNPTDTVKFLEGKIDWTIEFNSVTWFSNVATSL